MEENVVAGIREEELRLLSVEVLEYTDRVSSILDRIDACMNRLPSCYRGSVSTELMQRYENLKINFPTIKTNLKTYSDDLSNLIRKMRENDQYLSKLFLNYADDMREQAKIDQTNKIIN